MKKDAGHASGVDMQPTPGYGRSRFVAKPRTYASLLTYEFRVSVAGYLPDAWSEMISRILAFTTSGLCSSQET